MTEDEAVTKACCSGALRPQDNGACIASACMAWRWKHEQTNKQPFGGMSWPQAEPIYRRTEHGYCGLAGGAQ